MPRIPAEGNMLLMLRDLLIESQRAADRKRITAVRDKGYLSDLTATLALSPY